MLNFEKTTLEKKGEDDSLDLPQTEEKIGVEGEKPSGLDSIERAEKGMLERLKGKALSLCKFFMVLSSAVPLPAVTAAEVAGDFSDSGKNKNEAMANEIIFENSAFKLFVSPDKKSKNDQEVAKKIGLIHVEAVCDGELQTVNFTAEDLEKNPSLEVRGFLKGVMVLGDEVDVKINGEKTRQLESGTRENGKIKVGMPCLRTNDNLEIGEFSRSLSDSRVDSAYISEYLKEEGAGGKGKVPGTAYRGTFEKTETMNPIGYEQNNFVEVSGKNGKYVLPIKQEIEVISKKFSAGHHSVDLLYVGNGVEQFKKNKEINEKIQIISHAIGQIEDSLCDKKLVKGFEVINTELKNAQAEYGGYVRFTTGYLNGEDSATIINTTEHEVIHHHFFLNKLDENTELRELFADLQGYEGELKEEILKDGGLPQIVVAYSGANKNKDFFEFIKESNFFSKGGGHPTSNVREFICSLTHSLIYSDKLEGNLSKINQGDGQLSVKEQQLGILDNYEKTILVMLKASDSKKEKKFFEEKLGDILKLKEKL